ncbi:protein-glutamate methylesterase/protein-glutamine glutaminase [Celerinatantimonas diazotrophica]|uniref:Protein-glutamate methylesterase/protein-glutamine glutaminase n=1 Tax=Celerinatantimonas diazotrophica TaxID=412034 RepID=A0A4R1JM11_9GAMM|nr:chemotaxis response regulator protein-glutamate methylesterase [Celerinatantimonas diazotrophica]TCK52114.1 two-component system chemotaxis response regulator CheB [Celerinatantimonas diazotrophica]CAG9296181.1 Protein-glutamate methylesterase/protein-glutamine glutaminase 1 [Celerinatantimonas diazotrophica]
MTVKVLVVDDSSFFRRRVSEILNAEPTLEVIGAAKDGREAINMVIKLKPDVVTMDVEMPVLDGISAVREIMQKCPTPILMFSSLTHEGAKATLDALDAGALDFIPKKFEDIAKNRDEAIKLLQQRVKAIARRRFLMRRSSVSSNTSTQTPATSARSSKFTSATRPSTRSITRNEASVAPAAPATVVKRSGKSYRIVVIGTSTGGPVALQKVLTELPANFPHPILLIQHMPSTFTAAFAARLDSLCKISVKEAADGDQLHPGCAYLAPGGKQMIVENHSNNRIRIMDVDDPKINYKPCVDITFASVAKAFSDKALAIVLTGMGADGRDGARMLREYGSTVWAQDEQTCVVYGMPQAIAKAGLAQLQLPIDRFAQAIVTEAGHG